jgi:Putative prokaryotic signal transducing protein
MDKVIIRTYGIQQNAEIARGLLEEAGIVSLVVSDDAGGSFPNIFLTGIGFKLMVHSDDAEKAEEVLAVLDPENTK